MTVKDSRLRPSDAHWRVTHSDYNNYSNYNYNKPHSRQLYQLQYVKHAVVDKT